jgi:two-component system, chemotaxis family, protein-glutamate methylesterase/glutaminase
VDDSSTVRAGLVRILEEDPCIRVVGTAADGEEAVELTAALRPDLVTMDIVMPGMDGMAATRAIMETVPTPIVVVTGNADLDEVRAAFAAQAHGALACMAKPPGPGHPDHAAAAASLRRAVRAMAGVRVVRRHPPRVPPLPPLPHPAARRRPCLVAIGASTGGPVALRELLAGLSPAFPLPVLVVQHIAPGFADGFAAWLASETGRPVAVARDGDEPAPGAVLVAPDGHELGVGPDLRVRLAPRGAGRAQAPSVAHLFETVRSAVGAGAIAVLLSGMGRDGAAELLALREAGAVTIAQDPASSVVHGMPGAAIRLGAAAHVLPPAGIAALLDELAARATDS